MFPLNVTFAVNWTTPTNVAVGTIIPAGTFIYVGPTTGPVNVATAHGSGAVTTASFIFSDGTMTATVAGILYPVTAQAASAAMSQQQNRRMSWLGQQQIPFRSLGAAATPRHMIDQDDDEDDWIVNQTIVQPGQTGTVFSDGWNVRVCGNGKAMLIKTG